MGGSDPDKTFGRIECQKVGSLPPDLTFLRGDFRRGGCCKRLKTNSVGRASGEEVAAMKVQREILTVFTLFNSLLFLSCRGSCDACGQNTGRNLFVGWSDPKHRFGHGTVAKSGVAPAHSGVLPASKLIVAPCATSCPLPTWSMAKVTTRVTHRVICVFHAPVTSHAEESD